tara:strand:+ start:34 stop:681 length:648 start_codon:yes stop_codon:yes gene_type:complete
MAIVLDGTTGISAPEVTGVTKVTAGDMYITGANPVLRLTDTDGTDEYTNIANINGSTRIDSRDGAANGTIVFRGFGGGVLDEYARFDTTGQLGIGTLSPATALDVTGTVTATSYAGDGSALTGVGSSTAYAVGSHALVADYGAVVHNIGDTVAGSSLFTWELYSSADRSGGTTTFSTAGNSDGTAATSFTGTWRWLSSGPITSDRTRMGLAVRIS